MMGIMSMQYVCTRWNKNILFTETKLGQNVTLCAQQDEFSNNHHWSKRGSENGFRGVFQWNPNTLYGKKTKKKKSWISFEEEPKKNTLNNFDIFPLFFF